MNHNTLNNLNDKSTLSRAGALLLAGFLLAPGQSHAVPTSVELTSVNARSLVELDTDNGMNWFSVDGQNQLNKQWFYYGIGSGTVQYPINTLGLAGFTTTGTDQLNAIYANSQLSVSVEYVLTGAGWGTGKGDIMETLSIQNVSSLPIDLRFYQYSDFNLVGTAGGDSVMLDSSFVLQYEGPSQIQEGVALPTADGYEAAYIGDTLNNLATIPEYALNNVGGAGPGDVTWALQWNRTLGPNESVLIFKDKLLSIVPIPEPSTFAFIALGLGLWGLTKRRQ